MIERPLRDRCAPVAVSDWPPVPEICCVPIDSEQHWPVRSISTLVLMETWLSLRAMR